MSVSNSERRLQGECSNQSPQFEMTKASGGLLIIGSLSEAIVIVPAARARVVAGIAALALAAIAALAGGSTARIPPAAARMPAVIGRNSSPAAATSAISVGDFVVTAIAAEHQFIVAGCEGKGVRRSYPACWQKRDDRKNRGECQSVDPNSQCHTLACQRGAIP